MTAMPDGFHHIRLELAREPGHPEGDPRHGYDIVAPLNPDGYLDAAAWAANRRLCHARSFRPDVAAVTGHLVRKPGGSWHLAYEDGAAGEEAGFRFDEERFVPGEYVSIKERDGGLHTFKVAMVRPL